MSTFGRFTTADRFRHPPKANNSGSWNKYSYTENDPVNYHDPRGRERACDDDDDYSITVCGDDPGPDPYGGGRGGNYCDFNPGDPACSGTGTGDGDGESSAPTLQDLLHSAVSNAISALKGSKDCLNDFGTPVSRANGFNPIDVLNQISTNGGIVFAPLGPTVTAVTIPTVTNLFGGDTPGLSVQFGAVIVINSSSNPGTTAFSNGDLFQNTLTLLHELGHYYGFTSNSGGSALQTPDGISGNSANDLRIITDCLTTH
jgi:hypothetical protein